MKNLGKLIVSIGGCLTVALLGAAITLPSISSWYANLNKPFFNPPNWIFGPVWTVLYLLMGLSLYLIWSKKKSKKTDLAIYIFLLQLFLNLLWSFLFFYLHLPTAAFVEIIFLFVSILLTAMAFKKISRPAAFFFIPYLLWVSFASILNLSIVLLN